MLFLCTINLTGSRLTAELNSRFFPKHSRSYLKWLCVTCLGSRLPSSLLTSALAILNVQTLFLQPAVSFPHCLLDYSFLKPQLNTLCKMLTPPGWLIELLCLLWSQFKQCFFCFIVSFLCHFILSICLPSILQAPGRQGWFPIHIHNFSAHQSAQTIGTASFFPVKSKLPPSPLSYFFWSSS